MDQRNKRIDRINEALNKRLEAHAKEYQLAIGTILLLFVLGAIVVEIIKPEHFLGIMTGFTIILVTLSVLATLGYRKIVQSERENTHRIIVRIFRYEEQREQAVREFREREEEEHKKLREESKTQKKSCEEDEK